MCFRNAQWFVLRSWNHCLLLVPSWVYSCLYELDLAWKDFRLWGGFYCISITTNRRDLYPCLPVILRAWKPLPQYSSWSLSLHVLDQIREVEDSYFIHMPLTVPIMLCPSIGPLPHTHIIGGPYRILGPVSIAPLFTQTYFLSRD